MGNRRQALPVHNYFVGEALPPHLSPFISEDRRIGDYIPPEEKEMLGLLEKKEVLEKEKDAEEESEEESEGGSEEEEEHGEESEEEETKEAVKGMKVERGMPEMTDKNELKKAMDDEEYRLRVKMIPNKHKGLYRSMMKSRTRRVKESKKLERKRKMHDEAQEANTKSK